MPSLTAQPPVFDRAIDDIATYTHGYEIHSASAWQAAHQALLDSLACAFEARTVAACNSVIAPMIPEAIVPHGARVPATPWQLDPVEAAFATSTLIRWLDYNDAFYGETVIHPSDCIGALLAAADWQSRTRVAVGKPPLTMREVLDAMIRAYEVMGCLALNNAFTTGMGLDHVMLVKIAVAAVATKLMGGTLEEIRNAVSNAWLDGHALALYRRGPEAGARKSWAAGDAAARGVWLALLAMRGEMGYPKALSANTWGFCDVMNRGAPLKFPRAYGTHVIENLHYKIAYPAGIHAQSAAEAAIALHQQIGRRVAQISQIEIRTHRYAYGILNRTGMLKHVAERDHCLQYIVAIGLLFGRLEANDYEDAIAADPRIDALRAKTLLTEHAPYTKAFYDPAKRANPNSIRVTFDDGTRSDWVEVIYPVGHPKRRKEGVPLLKQKFEDSLARVFAEKHRREVVRICGDARQLLATPLNAFTDSIAL